MQQKINDFTQGEIFKPLIKFTVPIVFSLLLQVMYGAADLLIVGWFGSTADVSGVTTGSQIMAVLMHFVAGLSVGLTVLLGYKIGEKRSHEAGDVIGTGIILFALISVVLTAAVLILSEEIAVVMRAPQEAFGQTLQYVRICTGGMIFIVAYNLLGGVFRGIGDSKTPLLAVGIACAFNIAGDLLLVAVFHMGAAGAAIATVSAQLFSVIISVLILRRRKLPFVVGKKSFRWRREYVRRTLKLGVPIAIESIMAGLSFLFITAIVNNMGLIYSAAVGTAEKMGGFIMLVPICFMQSLSAWVAQQYGARTMPRARRAMFYSMAVSLGYGCLMFFLAFWHGEALAGLFNRTPEIIEQTALYLRAHAFDTLLVPFLFSFMGYFNGCGRTGFVMAQTIFGSFCIRIPLAFYFSRQSWASMFHIALGTPAATGVQVILCTVFYIFVNRKISGREEKKLSEG
ncbi:MAG: MATE family efflux transporter [Oscillospiraceae bacterium]|jgi:putative MATE family efflux protein|nr:MATE family efflux transporter [Oscillospiraceae bacterium]